MDFPPELIYAKTPSVLYVTIPGYLHDLLGCKDPSILVKMYSFQKQGFD